MTDNEEYFNNPEEYSDDWFCAVCGCSMNPIVSERGDLEYLCHCGHKESF